MPINWREELGTGNHVIDSQHKYLICLINTIEAAGNCRLRKEVIMTHLLQLQEYTHFHFEQEEQIQLDIKFKFHEIHKEEHACLIRRLEDLIEKFKGISEKVLREKQIEELFQFLRGWLVDHIVGEDMKMKPYF